MNLSIIVPLLNEEESLEELFTRIDQVCRDNKLSYEVWFIDDGSTDLSWSIIENLKIQHPQIHGIKFSKNYGKSQALHAAFEKVNGDVIIGKDGKNPLTPKEWIEDIRESKPYFFPKPHGAGGQGGNNSGSKNTIKRSEFDAMNPTEKANYIRKGGNVID